MSSQLELQSHLDYVYSTRPFRLAFAAAPSNEGWGRWL